MSNIFFRESVISFDLSDFRSVAIGALVYLISFDPWGAAIPLKWPEAGSGP